MVERFTPASRAAIAREERRQLGLQVRRGGPQINVKSTIRVGGRTIKRVEVDGQRADFIFSDGDVVTRVVQAEPSVSGVRRPQFQAGDVVQSGLDSGLSVSGAPQFADVSQETARGLMPLMRLDGGFQSSVIGERRIIDPATPQERFLEFIDIAEETTFNLPGSLEKRGLLNIRREDIFKKASMIDPVEAGGVAFGFLSIPATIFGRVPIPARIVRPISKGGSAIKQLFGSGGRSALLEAGTLKTVRTQVGDVGVGVTVGEGVIRTPKTQLPTRSFTVFTEEPVKAGVEARVLTEVIAGDDRFIVPTLARVKPGADVSIDPFVTGIFRAGKDVKLEKSIIGKAATSEAVDVFLGATSDKKVFTSAFKPLAKLKKETPSKLTTITDELFIAGEEITPLAFLKKIPKARPAPKPIKPFTSPEAMQQAVVTDDVVSSLVKNQLKEVSKLARPSVKVASRQVPATVPAAGFTGRSVVDDIFQETQQVGEAPGEIAARTPFKSAAQIESENLKFAGIQDTAASQGTAAGLGSLSLFGTGQASALGSSQISIFGQGISQSQAQSQAQAQAQDQALSQKTQPAQRTGGPRSRGRGRVPVPFPLFLPDIAGGGTAAMRGRGQPGYDVFSQRSGRVRKLNPEPLDRMSALGFGANIVDNTTDASFTIRKSKKDATGPRNDMWPQLSRKFRKRRSRRALELVEKRQYRIDTIGELMDLKAAPRRGIKTKEIKFL